ncbi:MAG: ferritin-like domain-containing protein [Burkholderiaceae bacterium]
MTICLRTTALELLLVSDPVRKAAQVQAVDAAALAVNADRDIPQPDGLPGRPARPLLVPPRKVPQRTLNSADGRAALIHALAHIEFNAINLALDAVWRFAGMPPQYYRDWFGVAVEEAQHFSLLRAHLLLLGHDYGSFDAHDGLWEIAEKTKSNALARMGLVPRLLEARGLDASPAIRDKLRQAGDVAAAEIVSIILRDEVGHVAIGKPWFAFLCDRSGVERTTTFNALLTQHGVSAPRPPFNIDARRAAGFSAEEIEAMLSSGAGSNVAKKNVSA